MKKYYIYKGKKKKVTLKDEEIHKYRDFNSLFVQYQELTKRQKVPIYRNKKIFLFLILIALIAYLLSKI
tara:strand:- start:833 stop:1039 length:207 start_codon:yes stop_codon:yes gene_type:complete